MNRFNRTDAYGSKSQYAQLVFRGEQNCQIFAFSRWQPMRENTVADIRKGIFTKPSDIVKASAGVTPSEGFEWRLLSARATASSRRALDRVVGNKSVPFGQLLAASSPFGDVFIRPRLASGYAGRRRRSQAVSDAELSVFCAF